MIKEFWPGASWKWPLSYVDKVMLSENFIRRLKHPWDVKIPLMLDSGAYSLILAHGTYPFPLIDYANDIRIWQPSVAWTMDYPCEPSIRAKWNFTPREAQTKTNENTIELNDKFQAGVASVVQGYELSDYLENLDLVKERGLLTERLGIGTLCRRGQNEQITEIVKAIYDNVPGWIKLHGFGMKISALRTEASQYLYSTDSSAWAWDWQQKGKQHRMAGTYYGIDGKLTDLRKYLARIDEISRWDQKMITEVAS